jgi:hypothetical protein
MTLADIFAKDGADERSELLELIPPSLMERLGVVPLARSGNRLMLAMVDPSDSLAIYDLHLQTGLDIYPVALQSLSATLPPAGELLDRNIALPAWKELVARSAPRADEETPTARNNVSYLRRRDNQPARGTQVNRVVTNGTCSIRLPAGSKLRGACLKIGGRTVEGSLLERHHTDESVGQNLPTVTIEQPIEGLLCITAANFPANQRAILQLDIVRHLETQATGAQLRFPLVLAPRHVKRLRTHYQIFSKNSTLVLIDQRAELGRCG